MFADQVLVVCPGCGGRAVNGLRPGLAPPARTGAYLFLSRRLACAQCAAVTDWEPQRRNNYRIGVATGGPDDPWFGHPLWLRTRCAGHILWAYNSAHVDELTSYVGATLRERGPLRPTMAMFARLPRWMKQADNRAQVLAGLARLGVLAGKCRPEDRS